MFSCHPLGWRMWVVSGWFSVAALAQDTNPNGAPILGVGGEISQSVYKKTWVQTGWHAMKPSAGFHGLLVDHDQRDARGISAIGGGGVARRSDQQSTQPNLAVFGHGGVAGW